MLEDKIIKYRRHIHQNPEIGYDTFETCKYVKNILDSLGYTTKTLVEGAAVVGYIDLGKDKTIGLRADMDALSMKENNSLEYKSSNNYMHACGHDAHTAMLLGASELIINNKEKLNVNVKLIFQCAEEGPLPGGAVKILETGILDDVDEFYALHVNNNFKVGEVAIKSGEAFAGPDNFDIRVIGKGSHGSTPEKGNNPVIPLGDIILNINNMIEDMRTSVPCASTITRVSASNAYNVISDEAYLGGTIRSFNIDIRNKIHDNIEEILDKISIKYNVKCIFNHYIGYDPLYNHPLSVDKFTSIAKNSDGIKNVILLDKPTMVGEDFTYYIKNKPGCIAWLGVRNENSKEIIDLHSPKFSIDEDALIIGSTLLYNLVLKS